MPELIEQMYCSQQIVIPPKFPYILKRYCKAAIKTQPYDLLRWSYEYFKAMAERRPPPVKLRLEYPVYSTEGGLTRGCLKVMANQLEGMTPIPLTIVKRAWQGFCLDSDELLRLLCLCEVHDREDSVPFLNFIAVAAGLLTKCLTHTMILLCETLTKEPDGGSAAIPTFSFLQMYRFLAQVDASRDIRYLNGFREGILPATKESLTEIEGYEESVPESDEESDNTFWRDGNYVKVNLINDKVPKTAKLSVQVNTSIFDNHDRSPSVERAAQIERENYMRERTGRPSASKEIDDKLRQMSGSKMTMDESKEEKGKKEKSEVTEKKKTGIEIHVFDEDDYEIPFELYGEPKELLIDEEFGEEGLIESTEARAEEEEEQKVEKENLAEQIALFVAECYNDREERLLDLETTFDEIAAIVNRFKSANYDLGMVAGRQMSTTSGEFIVAHIEKEIMDYINEQIAILPDPDLKKKKAKPEEVEMIRNILQTFLDENMDVIVPELEEAEEEEEPIPEIIVVYAVPGIGPPVEHEIVKAFEEYALEISEVQSGVFMPRNIRHFMCPLLQKYTEHKFDEEYPIKKEELTVGAAFTETNVYEVPT